MILDDENIARRHAIRPGFDLVSYRQVAIPLFRVFVRILVVEPKPLPPISEYIIHAIHHGLGNVAEIAGLLGLDDLVVQSNVGKLIDSNDVCMGAPPGTLKHRLMLTVKGQDTRINHEVIVPTEQTYFFYIDGLTREAVSVPRLAAKRPSRLDRDETDELPPTPRRNPTFDEVVAELRRYKSRAPDGDHIAKWDLLDVISVDRVENWFRDDAVALLFRERDGNETQVGFVIDDRQSETHERVYRETSRSNALRPILPVDFTEIRAPFTTKGQFDEQSDSAGLNNALFAWSQLTEQAARLNPYDPKLVHDRTRLRQEIRNLEQSIAELEAERDSLPFHPVEVYEHPRYLRKALGGVAVRLVIITPKIRPAIVNNPFIGDLENALLRGASVYIGYRDSDPELNAGARRRLEDLAKRFAGLKIAHIALAPSNLLLCDNWMIKTGFAWLSYRGDKTRPFTDERGLYISQPDELTIAFETLYSSFDTTLPIATSITGETNRKERLGNRRKRPSN